MLKVGIPITMSIVNLHKGYYFIHIPKTAGSSIETLVGGTGHYSFKSYNKNIVGLESSFGFAFVRDPWKRLLSCFYHTEPTTGKNTHGYELSPRGFKSFVLKEMKKDIGFYKKVYSWPEYPEGHTHRHYLPQSFYITDWAGNIGVDFVGRVENLEPDWRFVSEKIYGFYRPLPFVNKSLYVFDYKSHFDDNNVNAIVAEFYKDDFEIFGYDKNPKLNIG